MRESPKCHLCGHSSFSEHTEFPGSSLRYRDVSYAYARCETCFSIASLSGGPVDYTAYPTSKHIPWLPFKRFANFLPTCQVQKDKNILDFGCGNGAMVSALKNIGFVNIQGYEPYNPNYSQTLETGKFSLVYLTHVFEHLTDFEAFFSDLEKVTEANSTVIVICPSSTRIPKLDSSCPFQCYAIHAPFHIMIPSDRVLIDRFTEHQYHLRFHLPYDVQWSGIWDNGRVWALLNEAMGGAKERLMNVTLVDILASAFRSPLRFFDAMVLHTHDQFVSTFVFDKVS